ncbi:unnamed protein product [Diatraea saccharalis]|uniref:alpha-glucosidase n=1 Tax=Diatraea saccharalis TaxID=40085 RepID=A0A9N9QVF3_9NEOP|nr:unnamed protein product [Diatraea saccharalis]
MRASIFVPLLILVSGIVAYPSKLNEEEWWTKTIFYQIYPRSYADSDGDGIGDLKGIISKLEYIKELGVGAIWLSPIFQSPMYDFGYDISDFYAIHDEYGTMDDFEALTNRARELDIKVVLDLVPNHTSNESMWFQEALKGNKKYYDYFIWEDGIIDENGNRQPPNNWLSHFRGSAWEYREEVGKYYLHQFVVGQPDLNYRNPDVVQEMKDVISFWLNKGVHGFRVDAVNCLFEVDKNLFGGVYPDEPPSGRTDVDSGSHDSLSHIYTKDLNETYYMVYEWRALLDEFAEKDGVPRIMMTEVYATIQNVVRYYGEGDLKGAQIPFNFDLISDVDASSTAPDIKYTIDKFMTYKPVDEIPNWVVGNHDNSRMATRFGPSLVDGINMLVLLLPGVGVTYMGEEIGMVDGYVSWEDTVDPSGCNTNDPINYALSSRDPERTPFQWNADKNSGFSSAEKTWLPVAEGYETLNVAVQSEAEKSHWKIYQALAQLRQQRVFRKGRYESLALNKDVLAFKRWIKNDIYVIVLNLKDKEQEVDLTYFENVSKKLKLVLSSIQSTKKVGETFAASLLPLTPYEALVLKVK